VEPQSDVLAAELPPAMTVGDVVGFHIEDDQARPATILAEVTAVLSRDTVNLLTHRHLGERRAYTGVKRGTTTGRWSPKA